MDTDACEPAIVATMNTFEIASFGSGGLRRVVRPAPQIRPGQVLVQLKAASLNYRDLLMLEGTYNPKLALPVVPLSDGAGVVVAVGEGVTEFAPGHRVAACFVQGWLEGAPDRSVLRQTLGGPLDGMLTEMALLPERGLVAIPDHLSYVEAATLPCAALTAWSALVTHGPVRAGDTVVVLGTGGVSVFAIQFARLLGARVIATSSSDEKLARAREIGAHELINYAKTPRWEREVFRLTNKQGADMVVEVGGAGTLEQSIRAVRPGGTVSLIGVLAGGARDLQLLPILMQNIRLQGVLVGHRAGFLAMNRAIAQHGLRPVVDRVFPFAEAPAAYAHLRSQAHVGKVVVEID